jgi:hypothetical protein
MRVGVDLAKNVIQVRGVDARGAVATARAPQNSETTPVM